MTIVLIILLSVGLPVRAAEAPFPDAGTLKQIRLGEVVSETVAVDKGAAVRMTLMIHAPVEAIWATVYSCEFAFIFLDGLEVCEVLQNSELDTLTRQVVNKGWPIPRQDYSFYTHRTPFTRVDVQLAEGNLKILAASWDFIKMPEAVIVIYQVHIQPAFPAPRFLVRRTMNRGMLGLLACVRALAGGSGSAEREKQDLDQCPGDVSIRREIAH